MRLTIHGHAVRLRSAWVLAAIRGRPSSSWPTTAAIDFAQFIPDMLLRIELRGIAGEAMQADVPGNPQVLGSVGTSPIDDYDDEFLRMGQTHL